MVETVAQAGLIPVAEMMVHLSEKVLIVYGVWEETGGDARPRESWRCKLCVDGVDNRRSYADQSGLIQIAEFEVGEIESSVGTIGSGKTCPGLRLGERQHSMREGVGRVEAAVAKVTVSVAVKRVIAALADHIDVAAQGSAQLRLAAGCDHLEFLNHIQRVKCAGESRRIVVRSSCHRQ